MTSSTAIFEGLFISQIVSPDSIVKRAADSFAAKYGIKTSYVRMVGNVLFQRYAAEAEAGQFPADIAILSGTASPKYAEDAIKKGWADSLESSRLPVLLSGEFPTQAIRGPVARVKSAPWHITFNTEKLKGTDRPKDWLDVLNPKYKGQILLPDPRSADVYIEFFALMLDKYGEQFFTRLRAQNPRFYISGVPAIQGLAAGEGAILMPVAMAQISGVKKVGAPVDYVTPEYNSGVEHYLMLGNRTKIKHPNAGHLLANYLMSAEGNRVLNEDPGDTI